jgi:hypothetical protein
VSDPAPTTTAEVGVRTVVVGGLPLLVAGVPDHGPAADLLATVAARGLRPLAGVTGVELPRGAEVGFVVDTTELRLVDADDRALLRAPRSGLDPAWLDVAKRLKGTMTVIVRDLELDADSRPEQLVAAVDAAGSDGRVLGAIVGLLEERPQLPLLFG